MDQQQQPQRKAVIGPSIQVKGELVGNEDLVIEGKVEGVVRLRDNHLTVGKSAEVKATLEAKAIRIEGTVNGDVLATDRIELAAGSTLVGDIVAPRIIISDGARFKGSVDMDHSRNPQPAVVPARPNPVQAPAPETAGAGKPTP
jgi:cytoskeletal protein CcmA (bactofilin family)